MDKITQGNAALSEESAAAANEMQNQAQEVRHAVSELMRMITGQNATAEQTAAIGEACVFTPPPAAVRRQAKQPAPTRSNGQHPSRVAAPIFSDAAPRGTGGENFFNDMGKG